MLAGEIWSGAGIYKAQDMVLVMGQRNWSTLLSKLSPEEWVTHKSRPRVLQTLKGYFIGWACSAQWWSCSQLRWDDFCISYHSNLGYCPVWYQPASFISFYIPDYLLNSLWMLWNGFSLFFFMDFFVCFFWNYTWQCLRAISGSVLRRPCSAGNQSWASHMQSICLACYHNLSKSWSQ